MFPAGGAVAAHRDGGGYVRGLGVGALGGLAGVWARRNTGWDLDPARWL